MRRITALPLAALTLTTLAACTTGGAATAAPASHSTRPVAHSAPSTTPATTPPVSQTPTQTPTAAPPSSAPAVHFDTPEAAMRYLAAAYNRDDLAALKKVTNPDARNALDAMRTEAVNLRLKSCTRQPAGDYECNFTHDYPPGYTPDGSDAGEEQHGGQATFIVAPADNPGWYMTVLLDCG